MKQYDARDGIKEPEGNRILTSSPLSSLEHDASTRVRERGAFDMTDSKSSLTPSQAAALEQLQAITNGGDRDVAIDVLASVDWDVQVSTAARL